jgi:hypothetical protein
MQVISKEKKPHYFEYFFDTGHKYWVFSNFTKAYTPTGRYPSRKKTEEMERIISQWEDTRIQFPN